MAVIGCDVPVASVSGTEALAGAKGVWVKTNFYEKGDYLYARTYVVAAGDPLVFEMRIDLRPLMKIATAVHQRLHAQMAAKAGGPVVGFSFSKAFRSIKKAAKSIGKSKLLKSVGGALKGVVKSKAFGSVLAGLAVVVPAVGVPALAAYGAANAALSAVNKGKQLVHVATKAGATISAGTSAAAKVQAARAQVPSLVQQTAARVQAQAKAQAASIASRARAQAARSPVAAPQIVATAATHAKSVMADGARAAAAAKLAIPAQIAEAAAKVAPVVKAAASAKAKLADPAVQAKLLAIKRQSDSAKAAIASVAEQSRSGSPSDRLDAQKSAAILRLTAQNQSRLAQIGQAHAGGLPAILIDSRGRLIRGKWRVSTGRPTGKNRDVLYQGPKTANQAGAFAKVSGPLVGARHPSHPSLFPPPTPAERERKKALFDAWLAAQAKKAKRPAKVGWQDDPEIGRATASIHWGGDLVGCNPSVRGALGPSSIGCDCEGSQF